MGKFYDTPAVMQVIGGVFLNPSLLEIEDKYNFNEEDFCEDFHKVLFGSIYNLYHLGVKKINITTIEDYLEQKPKSLAVYKSNKGAEYLTKLSESTQSEAFDFYYQKMKKMTLLRMYQKAGLDLKWLYDEDNIFDLKKRQAQEEWLDNSSLEDIANIIDERIERIKIQYADNDVGEFNQAGEGILELVKRFETCPEVGYPMFGDYVNTIHRGARLKKFYLRSAATGVGKTRAMIADACFIACDEIFDDNKNEWVKNGTKEPVLYIATEQEKEEVQTMMLAFLSAVDEEHILQGAYEEGEKERVIYAAKLLSNSSLYIKELPDFSLQDIENTIKIGIRDWQCKYVFFDYLHSSMKILSEIGSKSGVRNLREDNILFLISVKLKDICNQYGVFIMTATQLNSDYTSAQQYDQNLLRGAKSIADKIDFGAIMLQTSAEDREALQDVINTMGLEMPEIKISVYKNRRGRYKDVLLWCKARRGICRIEPLFVTNYQMEILNIENLDIKVSEKENAF